MKNFKEFIQILKSGRPFGYIIPLLVLFFAFAWYITRDKNIIDFMKELTIAILTGGAYAWGHHDSKKK